MVFGWRKLATKTGAPEEEEGYKSGASGAKLFTAGTKKLSAKEGRPTGNVYKMELFFKKLLKLQDV